MPCPFGSGLRKFALDLVVVFFFKNAEKITSGGLILYTSTPPKYQVPAIVVR